MSINGPSEHLSWQDLACHDIEKTPYPEMWINSRLIPLAVIFEFIRHKCGNNPIIILSAYRTPEYNKKIGGAKFSQHIQGKALDLKPPNGMTTNQFYKLIMNIYGNTVIRGIGRYKNFVHIDIRSSDHLVTWTGNT